MRITIYVILISFIFRGTLCTLPQGFLLMGDVKHFAEVFPSVSFKFGENTILVPTFLGHGQFSPYILVAVNLVPVIFKFESIWSLPLTY